MRGCEEERISGLGMMQGMMYRDAEGRIGIFISPHAARYGDYLYLTNVSVFTE